MKRTLLTTILAAGSLLAMAREAWAGGAGIPLEANIAMVTGDIQLGAIAAGVLIVICLVFAAVRGMDNVTQWAFGICLFLGVVANADTIVQAMTGGAGGGGASVYSVEHIGK